MFSTILVANRGEIACRVLRTATAMGMRTVAVHSEADAAAAHVAAADEAVLIGPAPAAQSYLDMDAIIAAAKDTGALAIHPGYGFLSESAVFAERVQAAGITWVGPSPDVIDALGDKRRARERMARAGLPIADGGAVTGPDDAVDRARAVGYPVIVKPSAGGGGIGMRVAWDDDELRTAVQAAGSQAERFFGDGTLLVERYLAGARHVEIQILGLADGRAVVLGERDCSVQRRWQKVVEETPSPGVTPALRERMRRAAARAAEELGYRSAGTVECLVAGDEFVFCEVNARLQVEHPITEMCTGVDLVAEQFRVAAGDPPGFDPDKLTATGHALELRVYAEDPERFLPSPGRLEHLSLPSGDGIRVDAGYRQGDEVTRWYDPLIAKLCAHGPDRDAALARAREALAQTAIEGPRTNLPFLAEVLDDMEFAAGSYDTTFVGRLRPKLAVPSARPATT